MDIFDPANLFIRYQLMSFASEDLNRKHGIQYVNSHTEMKIESSPQRTINNPPITGSGTMTRTAIHFPISEAKIMMTALITTTRRLTTCIPDNINIR